MERFFELLASWFRTLSKSKRLERGFLAGELRSLAVPILVIMGVILLYDSPPARQLGPALGDLWSRTDFSYFTWSVLAGAVALAVAIVLRVKEKRAAPRSTPAIRPLSSWIMLLAAIIAGVSTAAVIVWLSRIAGDSPQLRIDAIRTGLTVAAGTGGLFALVLAVRRQRSTEIAALDTNADAREKRITEIYSKAVEQLGSDVASVRLGALYSLERVANDNLEHRQTILSMVCAYLRMDRKSRSSPVHRNRLRRGKKTEDRLKLHGPVALVDGSVDHDREVRLTAQRLIADRLERAEESADDDELRVEWRGMRLDLSNSVLENFSLRGRVLASANFNGTHFKGVADFSQCVFDEDATFIGAYFDSPALFKHSRFETLDLRNARFAGVVEFTECAGTVLALPEASLQGVDMVGADVDKIDMLGVKVSGRATFESIICDHADFRKSNFSSDVSFEYARLERGRFDDSTWLGSAIFDSARFRGPCEFRRANFESLASFDFAQIDSPAWFHAASFKVASFAGARLYSLRLEDCVFFDAADLSTARITRGAYFDRAEFRRGADFRGATFPQNVTFERTRFLGKTIFNDAQFDTLRFLKVTAREDLTFDRASVGQFQWQGGSASSVTFAYVPFSGQVKVEDVNIRKSLAFRVCRFERELSVTNVRVARTLEISHCTFNALVLLAMVRVAKSPAVPHTLPGGWDLKEDGAEWLAVEVDDHPCSAN